MWHSNIKSRLVAKKEETENEIYFGRAY